MLSPALSVPEKSETIPAISEYSPAQSRRDFGLSAMDFSPMHVGSPDHSKNLRLLQIGDDCQHPTVVGFVAGQVEFEEDRFDVLFDRSLADEEALGDGAV